MEMPSGVTFPSASFIQWYVDSSGVNDTDFSDGKGTIYSGESTTVSLTNTNEQISLYGSTTRDKNTIVDFVQYSTNGTISEPSDAQNAVDVNMWPSTDTFVNAAPAPEGGSLRLLPDGNDNNRPSAWSIDSSPTPGQTNAFVVPPGAPGNLDAQGGDEVVDITWGASSPGSDPIAGYRDYRGLSATPSPRSPSICPQLPRYCRYLPLPTSTPRAEDQNGGSDTSTSIALFEPTPLSPDESHRAGNPFKNDLLGHADIGVIQVIKIQNLPSTYFWLLRRLLTEVSTKTSYSDTAVVVGQQYLCRPCRRRRCWRPSTR